MKALGLRKSILHYSDKDTHTSNFGLLLFDEVRKTGELILFNGGVKLTGKELSSLGWKQWADVIIAKASDECKSLGGKLMKY